VYGFWVLNFPAAVVQRVVILAVVAGALIFLLAFGPRRVRAAVGVALLAAVCAVSILVASGTYSAREIAGWLLWR